MSSCSSTPLFLIFLDSITSPTMIIIWSIFYKFSIIFSFCNFVIRKFILTTIELIDINMAYLNHFSPVFPQKWSSVIFSVVSPPHRPRRKVHQMILWLVVVWPMLMMMKPDNPIWRVYYFSNRICRCCPPLYLLSYSALNIGKSFPFTFCRHSTIRPIVHVALQSIYNLCCVFVFRIACPVCLSLWLAACLSPLSPNLRQEEDLLDYIVWSFRDHLASVLHQIWTCGRRRPTIEAVQLTSDKKMDQNWICCWEVEQPS